MRFTILICLAVALLACFASAAEETKTAVESVVPVAVVSADTESVAELEDAVASDVPLVRSKRALLLLGKLKLAKLGLLGLGLGAVKVAAVGSLLKGGLGGGQQAQPQPQQYAQGYQQW